jgi:hypothetical protein
MSISKLLESVMITEECVLSAIGSTEASSFSEFCEALGGDCPARGDKASWRELFQTLRGLEEAGCVVIERDDRSIRSLLLTQAGANRVRSSSQAPPARPARSPSPFEDW